MVSQRAAYALSLSFSAAVISTFFWAASAQAPVASPTASPTASLSFSAAVISTFFLAASAQPPTASPTASPSQAPALALPPEYRAPRVALAVQGKKEDLQRWIALYGQMQSKDMVTLFLLSYDSPYKCPLSILCYYYPNSTWTTGRNELARRMFQREEENGQRFKYWAFHDADTWDLDCWVCRNSPKAKHRIACCYDQYVYFLLGPQNFAQVSPGHPVKVGVDVPPSPAAIVRVDCIDAMKNALHREAVSVLLPYIDTLDGVSWWISQALQFHVTAGCLSGYVTVLGGYGEAQVQEHTQYPQGRNDTLERETVDAVFRTKGLVPWPISGRYMGQGNCTGLPGLAEMASDRVFGSGNWMVSEPFLTCKAALKERFDAFVGNSAR